MENNILVYSQNFGIISEYKGNPIPSNTIDVNLFGLENCVSVKQDNNTYYFEFDSYKNMLIGAMDLYNRTSAILTNL